MRVLSDGSEHARVARRRCVASYRGRRLVLQNARPSARSWQQSAIGRPSSSGSILGRSMTDRIDAAGRPSAMYWKHMRSRA